MRTYIIIMPQTLSLLRRAVRFPNYNHFVNVSNERRSRRVSLKPLDETQISDHLSLWKFYNSTLENNSNLSYDGSYLQHGVTLWRTFSREEGLVYQLTSQDQR